MVYCCALSFSAMESALPEKRCVEDGKASQQREELSTPTEGTASWWTPYSPWQFHELIRRSDNETVLIVNVNDFTEKPQGDPDRPGVLGRENETEEEREKVGAEQEEEDGEEDGGSCANSTAHTEASAGQTNGDADTAASNASPKTPSKSPSANRTGRKNQVRLCFNRRGLIGICRLSSNIMHYCTSLLLIKINKTYSFWVFLFFFTLLQHLVMRINYILAWRLKDTKIRAAGQFLDNVYNYKLNKF